MLKTSVLLVLLINFRYVTILPNPSTCIIEITSNFNLGVIEVFSLNGTLLKSINKINRVQLLDLTFLKTGEYQIKLTEENTTFKKNNYSKIYEKLSL